MASVTEYLERLQKLTQTNLDLLKALNDSFYTKNSHLVVNVDSNKFVIPSFIQLENKINSLQENFENLVHAPKTGEASFNFDGNSQTIELKGFSCTPQSLNLTSPSTFEVENNDIFKDFLTPNPYVRFNITSIPNDISTVSVKKVVAFSDDMKEIFKGLPSNIEYGELYKKLSLYKEDQDYIEYDTIKRLPIRKTIGTGTYIIKSIDENKVDENLIETYTLTLYEELKYKLFDDTIEKYLQVGDELVTFDDSAKVKIKEVRHNTRQLVVEVLNGDYLNLVADENGNLASDMSKLKFYSSIDFNEDKYINIPLEEDQYVAIFIAPLNDRMNIRAPWGQGVILNVDNLLDVDGVNFRDYYNKNVKNIGDTLYELTALSSNSITKYSKDEYDVFTQYVPKLDTLDVYQINTHLNDSPTIQKIRNLYNQKIQYNSDLESVQKNIDEINKTLSSISFEDTTNIKVVYENQLTELNKKRNELNAALNSVMNEISLAANSGDVPIENAKYHIRGFFHLPNDDALNPYRNHINGIRVWYRYKNHNQETGLAHSIGADNIFSDWNETPIIKRNRAAILNGQIYTFEYPADNSASNEPSFNQIDIPITQGEIVDIKMQVIWDFGYPYIETTSAWSEIVSVEFPDKLKKNIQILDIIAENNNDIETNRFNNILKESGAITHIEDKLKDQDMTYFHQPEHIASGFYTEERRIIPLKDKLISINNDVTSLKDEVYGYGINNLKIFVATDTTSTLVSPNQQNIVYITEGQDIVNIQLTNSSTHSIKLHPLFVGSRKTLISDSKIYNTDDYKDFKINVIKDQQKQQVGGSVPKQAPAAQENENDNYSTKDQTLNQYLYFRNNDAWTGQPLYDTTTGTLSQLIIPCLRYEDQLCVNSDSKFDYLEIKPEESVLIPLDVTKLKLPTEDLTSKSSPSSNIQFTLRTTLYKEPTTYEITISRNQSNLLSQIQQTQSNLKYNPVAK